MCSLCLLNSSACACLSLHALTKLSCQPVMIPAFSLIERRFTVQSCNGTGATGRMDSLTRVEPSLLQSSVEPGICPGLGCSEFNVHSVRRGEGLCSDECTKLRSCLKRPSTCIRARGSLKVTFGFAVSFWFPGPLQLSLPQEAPPWPNSLALSSRSLGGSSRCLNCSPVGLVSGSSANPMPDAQHVLCNAGLSCTSNCLESGSTGSSFCSSPVGLVSGLSIPTVPDIPAVLPTGACIASSAAMDETMQGVLVRLLDV